MTTEPTKPIASPADGAGMEQASTSEQPAGDAVQQESEQEEPGDAEAAAQLGSLS